MRGGSLSRGPKLPSEVGSGAKHRLLKIGDSSQWAYVAASAPEFRLLDSRASARPEAARVVGAARPETGPHRMRPETGPHRIEKAVEGPLTVTGVQVEDIKFSP